MKKFIWWRGWYMCPLITIGRYTGWLTNGITFGVNYWQNDNTYYLGWLTLVIKVKHRPNFIERVNAGTWPEGWIWNIKYKK